ncbi:peptidoglycan DD-metalloendopeptidase family protein [Streptomyces sp. NPDC003077]|uniref:peptidoglycan DD-metalloendopeptidase family protein n=1 Tax=Streptomyces sp. NPDC003077 TaxID=3154443 RepID=UPI0033BA72D5
MPGPTGGLVPGAEGATAAPGWEQAADEASYDTVDDFLPPARGKHRVGKQRTGLARGSTVLGVGVIAAVGAGGVASAAGRPPAPISLPDAGGEADELSAQMVGADSVTGLTGASAPATSISEGSVAPDGSTPSADVAGGDGSSGNGPAPTAPHPSAGPSNGGTTLGDRAGETLLNRILQQAEQQQGADSDADFDSAFDSDSGSDEQISDGNADPWPVTVPRDEHTDQATQAPAAEQTTAPDPHAADPSPEPPAADAVPGPASAAPSPQAAPVMEQAAEQGEEAEPQASAPVASRSATTAHDSGATAVQGAGALEGEEPGVTVGQADEAASAEVPGRNVEGQETAGLTADEPTRPAASAEALTSGDTEPTSPEGKHAPSTGPVDAAIHATDAAQAQAHGQARVATAEARAETNGAPPTAEAPAVPSPQEAGPEDLPHLTGPHVAPLASHTLAAGYGQAGDRWLAHHTGQDFTAPTGTPVKAVHAGTITSAGWAGPYGYRVVLTLGDGTELWFCHLSSIVRASGPVEADEVIGRVGATGNVTAPHLHLEVRPNGGDPVDPLLWLRARGVEV